MNGRNIICYILFSLTLSCGVIDSSDSNENYNTLHGIDISNNGEKIFVSGRGDGKLHIFNTNDGDKSLSISLSENANTSIFEDSTIFFISLSVYLFVVRLN